MSRMFCISCSIPVVVDPDGRCPEGHDVAAWDDPGAGDAATDDTGGITVEDVPDDVDDEPAPWIADVPTSDTGTDVADGPRDEATTRGDDPADDDLAGDLLLPDSGGAPPAPAADTPGGALVDDGPTGDGPTGDPASGDDTHRLDLAAELASLLDHGDATGGGDDASGSGAEVDAGAGAAGAGAAGPEAAGPEASGGGAAGPGADDTQPIVRRVVTTSPVHPDTARGAVIDTTNFTARGERVGAARDRPGLWARLMRRRVS